MYTGFAGDTVAAALAANDRLGALALVQVPPPARRPHHGRPGRQHAGADRRRAQCAGRPARHRAGPRRHGAELRRQPGGRSRPAASSCFGRFLPVGFYYKAFFRRTAAWKFWEPIIRNRAGLGKVDPAAHHGYYDKQYLFADVAVVGGGPAGLSAALQAAESGAEVILIEEWPQPRRQSLLCPLRCARAMRPAPWRDEARRRRSGAKSNIRVLTRCRLHRLVLRQLAAHRPGQPPLQAPRQGGGHGDRLARAAGGLPQQRPARRHAGTAAQRLIRLYGVRPGRTAVVLTANDDGYGVALDLGDAGIEVQAVVDLREHVPESADGPCHARPRRADLRRLRRSPRRSRRTGKLGILGAAAARIVREGETDGAATVFDCDLICMSTGYSPAGQLLHHAGTRFAYDHAANMFQPTVAAAPSLSPRARSTAPIDLDAVLAEGRRIGWAAARDAGFDGGAEPPASPATGDALGQTHPWPIFPHKQGQGFRRFRRGPAGPGPRERHRRRLRQYRAAEALFHRRHGPVPGPPFRRRRRAHARQGDQDAIWPAIAVTTQRPPYRAGEIRPSRRPHLRARAPHGDASPPSASSAPG